MNSPRMGERPEPNPRAQLEADPCGSMLERIETSGIDLGNHQEYADWLSAIEAEEGEVTTVKVFHDLISHCISIGRGNVDRDMLADIAFTYADDAQIPYSEIRDARHDLFTGGVE